MEYRDSIGLHSLIPYQPPVSWIPVMGLNTTTMFLDLGVYQDGGYHVGGRPNNTIAFGGLYEVPLDKETTTSFSLGIQVFSVFEAHRNLSDLRAQTSETLRTGP